jgi:hypothetical protein
MRSVRPFHPEDFAGFELAVPQRRDFTASSAIEAVRVLAAGGRAFTVRDHEGSVLLIAGVARIDDGYGHAWAFMSAHAGPRMLFLTRKVRGYLDVLMRGQRRVEMMVRADFPQAIDWAGLLGFAQEGAMACAAPDGGDMVRFARVNPGWRAALEMAA